MKNRILVQTVVFLTLIFGIARTSYLQEQINVNVYINPPNAMVGVGETVSVDIVADQVTELGGFELDLSFDPNVINITKIEINNAFVIPVKEEINNTSGTGSIAAATLSTPQSRYCCGNPRGHRCCRRNYWHYPQWCHFRKNRWRGDPI